MGGRVNAKERPGQARSSLGLLNGGLLPICKGGVPGHVDLSMPNGLFVSISVVRFGLSLLAMMVDQVMTVRDLLGWGGGRLFHCVFVGTKRSAPFFLSLGSVIWAQSSCSLTESSGICLIARKSLLIVHEAVSIYKAFSSDFMLWLTCSDS